MRKDTFNSFSYKGYVIHTHYEASPGNMFSEVVKVQDLETLACVSVKSVHAAKCFITRRIACEKK